MGVPLSNSSDSSENPEGGTPAAIPNVRTIMAEIRARVRSEVAQNLDARPVFRPHPAEFSQGQTRRAGDLVHSEDLRYLNLNYTYGASPNLDSIVTHRGGIVGKLLVKCKRKLLSTIWNSLLRDYFQGEKEYQARVVRVLNETAKYIDARDASNFWELIRKIDVDVGRILERIERMQDENAASLRSTERRALEALGDTPGAMQRTVADIAARQQEQVAKLNVLESVARGLEGIVARTGSVAAAHSVLPASIPTDHIPPEHTAPPTAGTLTVTKDYSYVLLENRFRGSEEEITERLKRYPPIFAPSFATLNLPVLEIGPGRGELQTLFRAKEIRSYGVDTDAAMVEAATARGIDARLGDGIAHLESLPAQSLAGLIAIQVVEHLPPPVIKRLADLAREKVAPGGTIVFETINPESMQALSSNYFRDPTHVQPLHPDTLSYMLTLSGLEVVEVQKLSPVPASAQLQPIPDGEFMTPRWKTVVQAVNDNFKRMNDLLFGYQDFCVIARVPKQNR